jgi:uncharacterized protein (DUF488 family)
LPRFDTLQLPTDSFPVQLKNKATWNNSRSKHDADFFTIGYTGRTIGDFIELLTEAGVSCLVDVRHSAVSPYKPDFSRRNLQTHLSGHGIEYVHLPHLGIPRDVRGYAVGERNRDVLWEWYDANVIQAHLWNLDWFFNSVNHPVALMCTEVDPTSCHRHRIGLALERMGLRGFDL